MLVIQTATPACLIYTRSPPPILSPSTPPHCHNTPTTNLTSTPLWPNLKRNLKSSFSKKRSFLPVTTMPFGASSRSIKSFFPITLLTQAVMPLPILRGCAQLSHARLYAAMTSRFYRCPCASWGTALWWLFRSQALISR